MAGRPKTPENIYLRGDIYWGRVKIDGREHRGSLRTDDRREAKRRFKGWRDNLERDTFGVGDARTFKEAALKWNAEVLPRAVKPSVAKRYLVSIKQLAPVFGELRLTHITQAKIGEFISERTRTATNATIRRDLTALSRMLSACVSWGWITENPARNYDRSIIREKREPIEAPAREDIERVISAAPPGMAAILRLLDQTGMREAEAVSLDAREVDWPGHKIALTRTKTNRPRTIDWETPGGDAGPVLAGAARAGTLFVTEGGDPYRNFSSNFGRVIRAVVEVEKKAGGQFRRFRVHDLRHGFAIRWLQKGGGIYPLSLHLGHTSVKTTEIYLGRLTGREQAVARLGAQETQNMRNSGATNSGRM